MASKHFQDLLKKMDEIHIKKNADYASEGKAFENFERAAVLVSWFKDPIDQVFAGIIGIKLARLAVLSEPGKVPNNESIDDTYLDSTNYFGLWAAYKLYKRDKEQKLEPGMIENKTNYLHMLGCSFPIICTNCKQQPSVVNFIKHIQEVHSAIIDRQSNTAKYPNRQIILLTPEFYNSIY